MMTDISERTKVVDLFDTTRSIRAMAAKTKTTANIGSIRASGMAIVDLLGYESCMFALMGAGIANATFTVKHGDDDQQLEEADEYCLVQDDEVEPTDKVKRLGYIGARRFVQIESTVSPTSGVAVLQRPAACPKTNETTYTS